MEKQKPTDCAHYRKKYGVGYCDKSKTPCLLNGIWTIACGYFKEKDK